MAGPANGRTDGRRRAITFSAAYFNVSECRDMRDICGLQFHKPCCAFRLSNPTCGPTPHHGRSPGRRRGRYSVHPPHHSERLQALLLMRRKLKGRSSGPPRPFAFVLPHGHQSMIEGSSRDLLRSMQRNRFNFHAALSQRQEPPDGSRSNAARGAGGEPRPVGDVSALTLTSCREMPLEKPS